MKSCHDNPILRFDNVTLGYRRRVVLEKLSFHICRGEFLGIVGPNGSGKTTILRAILGLLRPQAGQISRTGTGIIGYVPQRENIDTIVPVSAMEVALMGRAPRLGPLARLHPIDREKAHQSLAVTGVAHLASLPFRELSGGQQQRVLIARALASDPDLIVLDEPTNGMDLASEHAIVKLLTSLHRERGLTVLLVTHLLPIVLNAATSILLIDSGKILYGEACEVLEEKKLTELYQIPVRLVEAGGIRTLVTGAGDERHV